MPILRLLYVDIYTRDLKVLLILFCSFPLTTYLKQKITQKMTRQRSNHGRILTQTAYHIDNIKYDSTCISLGLPSDLMCLKCKSVSDILTKKSSHQEKKNKKLHVSNRCKNTGTLVGVNKNMQQMAH